MKREIIKWVIYSFISSAAAGQGWAQGNEALADQYYKSNDCEKAIIVYKTVLEDAFNRMALKNFIDCLIKTQQIEEGEKYLKKAIKSDNLNANWYYLYWGTLLEAKNKPEDALKKYKQAIASIGERIDQNREMADEFRRIEHADMSLIALKKAREVAKRPDLFQLEVASIYRDLNQPEDMINELLAYGVQYQNVELVQNMLQDYLRDEKEQILLENELYKKIQSYPNEGFYTELLIWYQIQKKDFYKAFIQEKALDRRFKHQGERLFNLGLLAAQNLDYGSAENIFDYLVQQYPQGNIYPVARRMAIFVKEQRVRTSYPINASDVKNLISQYQKLIADLGSNNRTVESFRNIANLYAFFLSDFDKAIIALQTAVEVGASNQNFVDNCKLDLGDIYLLKGEPWEASLLYSQVEKSQKENLLGYDAKLRNAKLHYYSGDFDLARDILNILKKATSREIANDANDLSLLIMDNTGLDSSETAMKEYAYIELLLFQNKKYVAIDSLKSMLTKYSKHSLTDELLWLTAKTFISLDSNQKAVKYLNIINENFSHDILGDNALFELGKLYEEKLKDKTAAMKIYQEILNKYPGSIFVAESRKRFRLLRGDLIN